MKIYSVARAYLRSLPDDAVLRELKNLLPAITRLNIGAGPATKRILIQAVADPYYLSLFSAILCEMSKHSKVTCELFMFRSIEAETGNGFKASLKRLFPFTWLISKQWARMYAGVAPAVGYRSVSWSRPIEDARAYFRARTIWKGLQSLADLERLTISDVKCGELIIDTYLRFRPAATVDLKDPFLRYLIWQAYRDVFRAARYFGRKRPDIFLSSYSTYIQHGIAVRVALAHGTKVVTFGNLQQIGKVLSTEDIFHTKNPTNYRTEFEQRTDQEELRQSARTQLETRLSGGTDAATSYMATSAYAAAPVACPDVNGAVLIYLHDFFDSPHVYADLVFPDFWTWICFTIETLRAAGIRFFIKPHPNQISLSAGVVDALVRQYPNLNFVPNNVTTRQLVDGGMVCAVTVYGTIAHEVAYLGIPAIACARHPHIAFDFCHTGRSVEEYESLLKRSCSLAFPDPAEARRQVLEFYAMHNLDLPADQLAARNRLIELWKTCHAPGRTAKSIATALAALTHEPGFSRFVRSLLSGGVQGVGALTPRYCEGSASELA